MTFGMACDLYDKGKYVVYGNYGSPIGNHFITSGPKLAYNFFNFLFLKSRAKTAIILQLRWNSIAEVTFITCCTTKLRNKQDSV